MLTAKELNPFFDECYRVIRNKGRLIIQFRDVKEICDKINYSGGINDITALMYVDDSVKQNSSMNSECLNKILLDHKFELFKENVYSNGIYKQNIYKKISGYKLDDYTSHWLAKFLQVPISFLNYMVDNLDRLSKYERDLYLNNDEYNEYGITSLIKQLIDPLLILDYDIMPDDRILLCRKNINCLLWDSDRYRNVVLCQSGMVSEYNKWLYDCLGINIKVINREELKQEDKFDVIIIDKGSEDKEKLSNYLMDDGKFIEVDK
jgi:hypothetical protein